MEDFEFLTDLDIDVTTYINHNNAVFASVLKNSTKLWKNVFISTHAISTAVFGFIHGNVSLLKQSCSASIGVIFECVCRNANAYRYFAISFMRNLQLTVRITNGFDFSRRRKGPVICDCFTNGRSNREYIVTF